MYCPILTELPPPPPDRIGWPWTQETPQLPQNTPDGGRWPCISIVTPSYNQSQFIEETIRSILLQGYPNIDYKIIDGGSTDGSVEIIRKYEKFLTYWVSEKDRGQSHAINKGFKRATGGILCWMNSDDFFKPGVFGVVARHFRETSATAWLVGGSEVIDHTGHLLYLRVPGTVTYQSLIGWFNKSWFPQQSAFWTRSMWEAAGPLDEDRHYAMDLALWLRMFEQSEPIILRDVLSCYRQYDEAKCMANMDRLLQETIEVLRTHFQQVPKDKVRQLSLKKHLGEEVFYWAQQRFLHHQHREARQLLFSAFRISPRLLNNRKAIWLLLKLLIGPKILITLGKIKKAKIVL